MPRSLWHIYDVRRASVGKLHNADTFTPSGRAVSAEPRRRRPRNHLVLVRRVTSRLDVLARIVWGGRLAVYVRPAGFPPIAAGFLLHGQAPLKIHFASLWTIRSSLAVWPPRASAWKRPGASSSEPAASWCSRGMSQPIHHLAPLRPRAACAARHGLAVQLESPCVAAQEVPAPSLLKRGSDCLSHPLSLATWTGAAAPSD